MKKFLFITGLVVLVAFAWFATKPKPAQGPTGGGGSGTQFYYTSATTATTSVATSWSATPVVPQDSSRGFVSFCNDNPTSTNAIYLGMGATTTGVSGIKIAGNSCYEMNNSKMFYGNIYAIASPTATSLLTVIGKY